MLNPSGLCECGCGEQSPLAKYNSKKWGWIKGEPVRFIHNHHHRGARNVNYNMGLCFDKSQKRWFIHTRDNSYIAFARAVLENTIGRLLLPGEVAHHKNRNRTDDSPGNLKLKANQREHMQEHFRYTDEELLQILRNMATSLGRIPLTSDLEKDHTKPTRETYRIRLGGFKNARILAGLEVAQGEHMQGPIRYTDEELLQALRNMAASLGRAPLTSDFEKRHICPSKDTYRVRLGGLKRARILAGLESEAKRYAQ